jgi:hypothetical protein
MSRILSCPEPDPAFSDRRRATTSRGLRVLARGAVALLLAALAAQLVLHAVGASSFPALAYKTAAQCRALTDSASTLGGSNRLCGPIERLAQPGTAPLLAALPAAAFASQTQAVYPLRVSDNKRYLVDQSGSPFLMVGDSPQALIGGLSLDDAEYFLSDRHDRGFNTVWVNLLCADYTGCNADGTTFDGIAPFHKRGDLTTPNEAYFERADRVLAAAAKYGMLVILDPIETGSWLKVLESNGPDAAYRFGQYLGNRYKSQANIIWMSGNDYQTWGDPVDDALVLAVAQGIKDSGATQLQTVELNYRVSSSLDDPRWQSVIQLDAAYTYKPTYAEVLKEYQRLDFMPVFMVEASYESENDYTGPQTLRRQEYWSLLSGAAGQLYGNRYTWQFLGDWKNHLDTIGTVQLNYCTALFASRRWYDLVPDADHTVVTAGYGTFTDSGTVNDSDYLTAARTADGALIIVYAPTQRSFTVDLTKATGPVKARWFDPASGAYAELAGSPLPNTGVHQFQTPGANGDGDYDWVLVLESQPG